MENTLELIGKLYAGAAHAVIFADSQFQILWTNRPELTANLPRKTVFSLFQEKISLPAGSGDYPGKLGGVPVRCSLVQTEYEGKTAYLIEIAEQDMILETMKNPAVGEYLRDYSARVREAVSGICSQARNLYEVLVENDSYQELQYLNVQMWQCYRMLKNSLLPAELLLYAQNAMEEVPVSLNEVFEESRQMHREILNRKADSVSIVCKEGLTVSCDRERLVRMMLFCEMFLLEKGILQMELSAEGNDSEVFLTFSAKHEADPLRLKETFSVEAGSGLGMENAYLYALRLFCKRFGGELLLSAGNHTAVQIRLPRCWEYPAGGVLKAPEVQYGEDRFTPYHFVLSDYYEFPFYL